MLDGLTTSWGKLGGASAISSATSARHGQAVQVECGLQLPSDCRKSSGPVQIFHVALAGRSQIDQDGGFASEAVEPIEIDLDSGAPGYGGQVNQGRWSSRLPRELFLARW